MDKQVTQLPATEQCPKAADRSALESFLLRNSLNGNSGFGRRFGGINFATPDEIAAQKAAEEKETALVEKLTSRISEQIESKYSKQINGMSAELRKLKEEKKPKEDDKDKDEEEGTLREELRKLKEGQKEKDRIAAEKEARGRQSRIKAELQILATKHQINPEYMEDFEAHVDKHYGKTIQLEDSTDTIQVREGEYADPKPFGVWFEGMAKAGKFNKYRAAKATVTKGQSSAAKTGNSSDGKLTFTDSEWRAYLATGQPYDPANVEVVPD